MHLSSRGGFSLVELVVVATLMVILMAIAIPQIALGDRARVNTAAGELRETLQTARLRAVAVNRSLQVRFNCPSAGQYRIVQAGSWDGDANRCDSSEYPYPAARDAAYQDPPKPRYDGPVKMVHPRVTVTAGDASILQFFPNGRVMKLVSGVTQDFSSASVTVSANGYQKTIDINSLGKVLTQ